MRHFIDGISLLFNPSLAKRKYFPEPKIGYARHFQNAFGYLAKTYNEEKKKYDSPN
ncbi:MAG: hypothetical protein ACPHYB_03715 [Flavobacteriaceae bacterium]